MAKVANKADKSKGVKSKTNSGNWKQNPKRKKKGKKRIALKKIFTINRHNQNAKRLKNERSVDPFREEFIPTNSKECDAPKEIGQKPSRKMQAILNMMQDLKNIESQDQSDVLRDGLELKDGKLLLPKSEDEMPEEDPSTKVESLVGKDFSELNRKQKRKVRSKVSKENKKVQKLEKSLKKMYRKDKTLEIDHDFTQRLGEDEIEFGEEVKEPPKKDLFEKTKKKVLNSKAKFMTEEELRRYELKQIAIQRNMEIQLQKAKQIFSRKKREMLSDYAEFEEVKDWD